jgi:hypothetical protein
VAGFLGRVAVFGILSNKPVAVWMVHFKLEFFCQLVRLKKG